MLSPRLRAVAVALLGSPALSICCAGGSSADAASVSNTKVIVQTVTHPRDEPADGVGIAVPRQARRVFVNAFDGFALISVRGQLTPVRTTDRGATWQIDGPGIFTESAADAALVVDNLDALSASTFYAYGGGQVVDITSDGGRLWRRVIFQGLVAGVSPFNNGLAAYVDESNRTGSERSTLQFYSADDGRSWRVINRSNLADGHAGAAGRAGRLIAHRPRRTSPVRELPRTTA
jgi:hypothetical protein